MSELASAASEKAGNALGLSAVALAKTGLSAVALAKAGGFFQRMHDP